MGSSTLSTNSPSCISSWFQQRFSCLGDYQTPSRWRKAAGVPFMSSWLGASDANGDMNDRLDMVWRMIDSAEGGGTSDDCTSEWVAKAALIGCTQIADEQTHQLLPSLLSRVEDEHLSSQAKAASLLCLSLLVPGLVPRQDALMNAIVATISLQIDASSSSIVQRSCFEILGKIVYYMVKSNFPSADLVASTILCRFLDALRHIKEFALICTEIEQRLPSNNHHQQQHKSHKWWWRKQLFGVGLWHCCGTWLDGESSTKGKGRSIF